MRDLYSTLFYKIKFNVEAKDSDDDILWHIVLLIKEWMTKKHNRKEQCLPCENDPWCELKNGGQISGKRVRLFAEYCHVDDPFPATYWACKIIESPKAVSPDIAPREWTTEIGVEPVGPRTVTFSCIISYSDRPGFVGKCDDVPNPSIPNVIKLIWDDAGFECKNGIDIPSIEPRRILPGEWDCFWERIKDVNRTLPYVYISPKNYTENGEPLLLVDPQQVALVMGGNAVVYYADDVGVTVEMNYRCPEDYKCYNGTIRVYYPGVEETQPKDAYRHRFLSAGFIEKTGKEELLGILRRAIAQDAHFYEDFFRIEECKEKRNGIVRQQKLRELKEKHEEELAIRDEKHSEEKKSIEEKALRMVEEAVEKQLIAEDKAAHLDNENHELRNENYNLNIMNDSYILLDKENKSLKRACENRLSTKKYPKTPLAVVQYFDASFHDCIAFSDDAMDSLKECRIPLEDLWEVLFALATIMKDLYANGSGDIYREFRVQSGIDVSRGEGMMTRKDNKLMRQYKTMYHGEEIDIEAHITYPKLGQSIHFGFSKTDNKLIVGWCGKHKDNYTTGKLH